MRLQGKRGLNRKGGGEKDNKNNCSYSEVTDKYRSKIYNQIKLNNFLFQIKNNCSNNFKKNPLAYYFFYELKMWVLVN